MGIGNYVLEAAQLLGSERAYLTLTYNMVLHRGLIVTSLAARAELCHQMAKTFGEKSGLAAHGVKLDDIVAASPENNVPRANLERDFQIRLSGEITSGRLMQVPAYMLLGPEGSAQIDRMFVQYPTGIEDMFGLGLDFPKTTCEVGPIKDPASVEHRARVAKWTEKAKEWGFSGSELLILGRG